MGGEEFDRSLVVLCGEYLHSLDHCVWVVAGSDEIVEAAQISFLLIFSAVSQAQNLLRDVGDGRNAARCVVGGDGGEQDVEANLLAHSVSGVSCDDVDGLMGEYAGELGLCLQAFEHALCDEDESAGQCESVDGLVLDCCELELEVGPVADSDDGLANAVYVFLNCGVGYSAAHLLFDFGGVFLADFDVLLFGNEHKLALAGDRVGCAAREQA